MTFQSGLLPLQTLTKNNAKKKKFTKTLVAILSAQPNNTLTK